MGNIISTFFSGFAKSIGNLFGSPLDFLAGKSCRYFCGSTWDFICYIENFCVANLLKMAMVLVLFYIVLLFLYLLLKLGICQCLGRSLCKTIWACISTCFSSFTHCCTFFCFELRKVKQKHRKDIEDFDTTSEDEYYYDDENMSYDVPRTLELGSRFLSRRFRGRDYRGAHLKRSLRPRTHRVRVGVSKVGSVHDIRVMQMSKFVQKSGNHKRRSYRKRRW